VRVPYLFGKTLKREGRSSIFAGKFTHTYTWDGGKLKTTLRLGKEKEKPTECKKEGGVQIKVTSLLA